MPSLILAGSSSSSSSLLLRHKPCGLIVPFFKQKMEMGSVSVRLEWVSWVSCVCGAALWLWLRHLMAFKAGGQSFCNLPWPFSVRPRFLFKPRIATPEASGGSGASL